VAREHGFRDWEDASTRGQVGFDDDFEHAASAVVYGRREELTGVLTRRPELARATSAYGHRATFLHYVAANGMESRRGDSECPTTPSALQRRSSRLAPMSPRKPTCTEEDRRRSPSS
jgi:hypothetical protein